MVCGHLLSLNRYKILTDLQKVINSMPYNNILENSTLWQHFGEGPFSIPAQWSCAQIKIHLTGVKLLDWPAQNLNTRMNWNADRVTKLLCQALSILSTSIASKLMGTKSHKTFHGFCCLNNLIWFKLHLWSMVVSGIWMGTEQKNRTEV